MNDTSQRELWSMNSDQLRKESERGQSYILMFLRQFPPMMKHS